MLDFSSAILVAAILTGLTYLAVNGRLRIKPSRKTVVVKAAIDGESFQLTERFQGFLNVRIAGVRAPSGDEDGAEWAAETLASLINGKTCELQPVDEDPDGFLIARVLLDGVDVGAYLVDRGHAIRSQTLFRGAFRRADEV